MANPFGHCPRACPCPWALASTSCYQSFFVWSRSQSLWGRWSQDTLSLHPEQIRARFGNWHRSGDGQPWAQLAEAVGGLGLPSRHLDLANTGLLPGPRSGEQWPEAQQASSLGLALPCGYGHVPATHRASFFSVTCVLMGDSPLWMQLELNCMAQMGSAGKSDQGAVREGFLGEEGFGLSCDEKEGQLGPGDNSTRGKSQVLPTAQGRLDVSIDSWSEPDLAQPANEPLPHSGFVSLQNTVT